ncbi:arrestin domain-containing protein 4 [Tupaia chinensis]|uniref:arrestin domain-containing protein 4 n=1 Tax=Tupaia chinensis TaxID=246437 RepID=UPI000FFB3701|nr:arrestin domain-containing protein 4 [Tupaia chinensis]
MAITVEKPGGGGLGAPEPVALRALRLEAQGRATASWGPSAGARVSASTATPAAASEVEYLDVRLSLREPPAGEDIILLQPGKHEFPFRFQLPSEPLVTSFTGKYGSIQYCVRAVVERPKAPAQTVKRDLQVVSHIDVNTPALLTPVLKTQEKMVGCWFFTSGPVSLSARIERKGYCNGEAIPIYAEIENCSSRLIVPKAAIFQTQTYLASGKTKTVRHIPDNVYIHIPGAQKLMLELPLVIGTVPYNGFGNCSVPSHFSVDMSWLTLALPEQPEAPPNYADVVSEEEFSRHVPPLPQPPDCEGEVCCPVFACIQEFRFQPPPLYSEVDPHPCDVEDTQPVSFIL